MEDKDFEIVANLKGGSLAGVRLIKRDGRLFIRKEASALESKYAFQKLQEQFEWMNNHQNLSPTIPKVTRSGHIGADMFFYEMEYYESKGFFEFIHSTPIGRSKKILSDLLDFCFEKIYYEIPQPTKEQKQLLANKLVQQKLFDKVNETKKISQTIATLQKYKTIYVNNEEYLNFNEVSQKLLKLDVAGTLSDYTTHQIHGDVTVENILCTEKAFLLIDPNPDNIVNTRLVDVTKLSQSLNWGYEFLVDSNDCQILGNQIIYNDNTSIQYSELKKTLLSKANTLLDENEKKKFSVFDALNYSRLLPLRAKIRPETGPIYYGVLIKILNNAIQDLEGTN